MAYIINRRYTASFFAVFIIILMISSSSISSGLTSRSKIALPFPYILQRAYADDSGSNSHSSGDHAKSGGGDNNGDDVVVD